MKSAIAYKLSILLFINTSY